MNSQTINSETLPADNPNSLSKLGFAVNPVDDARGVSKLAIDGVHGVVDITESLHQTILSLGGILEPTSDRTRGITGLVYRSIRGVTSFVGNTLDSHLDVFSDLLPTWNRTPAAEATISALNGVLGDHLSATGNPLAIKMRFRKWGRAVDESELKAISQQGSKKLVIAIHGLCMNDQQWSPGSGDSGHDRRLLEDFDCDVLHLHYNTGLHISENGRLFSELMAKLCLYANPDLQITVLTHSMGGLVARSAMSYAEKNNSPWLSHVKAAFFLGTPHHGAPLEKGGNWVDMLLKVSPYSAPFTRLAELRSSGITDLRFGNIQDEDWNTQDRFKFGKDKRIPTPLPVFVRCFNLAGVVGESDCAVNKNIVGDGLVTLNSALGKHKRKELSLDIPDSHRWVGDNLDHLGLLDDERVYKQIKSWLSVIW